MNAASWNLGKLAADFVFRLASNLIMTRLLMPDAFGVLAFAMTFVTALTMLTDVGIYPSIVREKDRMGPHFLRVAWTLKILQSCVVAVGVLVMALVFAWVGPSIAAPGSAMAAPEVPLLIAMTALVPIGQGLVSTNWEAAQRRMDFPRIVALSIAAMVIRILCQIGFALISPTVWALMFGTLMGGFSKTVLSHLFLKGPKMRPVWDRELVLRLWGFGKWVLGSSSVHFLVTNTDKLIFSAVVSSTAMGLYVIAFIWIGAARQVMNVFSRTIGLSVASEIIRERPDEARRLLRKFQFVYDLLGLCAFIVFLLAGPLLIRILYTEPYLEAGQIIQLLAPLMLALRYGQMVNLLLVLGNSKATFIQASIAAVATVIFLLAGLYLAGFWGGVSGMVLARFAPVPYILYHTGQFFSRRDTIYDAAFGIFGALSVAGTYLFVALS